MRSLVLKLGQHRVEHPAGDLVAMVGVIEGKRDDIICSLDDQSGYVGTRRVGFLRRHAANAIQGNKPCQQCAVFIARKDALLAEHYWLLEDAYIDNSAADVTNV